MAKQSWVRERSLRQSLSMKRWQSFPSSFLEPICFGHGPAAPKEEQTQGTKILPDPEFQAAWGNPEILTDFWVWEPPERGKIALIRGALSTSGCFSPAESGIWNRIWQQLPEIWWCSGAAFGCQQSILDLGILAAAQAGHRKRWNLAANNSW